MRVEKEQTRTELLAEIDRLKAELELRDKVIEQFGVLLNHSHKIKVDLKQPDEIELLVESDHPDYQGCFSGHGHLSLPDAFAHLAGRGE